MHEIDMLMHFFMVPGSENHYFDEFLMFYFEEKVEKSKISKTIFLTPCSKSLNKAISDAQT